MYHPVMHTEHTKSFSFVDEVVLASLGEPGVVLGSLLDAAITTRHSCNTMLVEWCTCTQSVF